MASLFAGIALLRRCKRRDFTLCRRRSDGSLWAASCPQNMGYAMRGLFSGGGFHFVKARRWRGSLIVARKVFWLPESSEFDVLSECAGFWLPPWPEAVECRKLDLAAEPTP